MKLSARNVLKGTVLTVTPGAVNTEVVVKLAEGIEVVAIVSKESVETLGLKPGSSAYVIIKASNVILGAD
jgi:molybdate transport system regulatory protein